MIADKQAVKWRLLLRNPADSVDPPTPIRREVTAIDEDRSAELIEAATGTRLYLPIILASTTGMRRGEILALRWNDFDLRGALVLVKRSVEETKQGIAFKRPKNGRARQITMPEILISALREHKREQTRYREMYGADDETAADLVCCRPDGSV